MTTTLLNRPNDTSIELKGALFPHGYPWLEQTKTFKHPIDIYLKDSNATGNVYFARYFEWQGICREKWFFECIAADMLQSIGVFITKEAQQSYMHETYAFQKVDCEVNTFAIRQCSFSLLFKFFCGRGNWCQYRASANRLRESKQEKLHGYRLTSSRKFANTKLRRKPQARCTSVLRHRLSGPWPYSFLPMPRRPMASATGSPLSSCRTGK